MMQRDNVPLSTLAPLSKKPYEEVLTSHNISIVLLIQAYIEKRSDDSCPINTNLRRGFCKIIQFLLQSPDYSFSQFVSVVSDEKYSLGQEIVNKFLQNVSEVVNADIDLLLTSVNTTGRYLMETVGCGPLSSCIHRSSPVGLFLRKMLVFLDKLTFSQTVKVYRLYQQYYLLGRSELKCEFTAVRLSGTNESSIVSQDVNMDSASMQNTDLTYSIDTMKTHLNESSMNVSMDEEDSPPNLFTNPIVSLFGVNHVPESDEKYVECLSWSRRQTELFLAEQSTLLQFDENSALPPPDLHRILKKIMIINPEYCETYFVNYLNCLRVKEFNGAQENLIKFFDLVNFTDKSKSYRFAALNLVIFHVKFGNRIGALSALKECITLSHESSDNLCLHIAQAWLRCLDETDKINMIESTVLKCEKAELFQIASLSLQMCAQKMLHLGLNRNVILSLLDKSDSVNAQNRLPDMTLTSIAHRSSIWCTYGQLNVSFIISQVLLNIDTSYEIYGLKTYNTEDVCTSICNVAGFLSNVGEYHLAKLVLTHAISRFPHEFSKWWKLCEQILLFEHTLQRALWNESYQAAQRICNIDKKEGMLRLAELSIEKSNMDEATAEIEGLIKYIHTNVDEDINRPYLLMRAYIIGARAKTGASAFHYLRKALDLSMRYDYPRFRAIIQLELAKIQLDMGFVGHATDLVNKSCVLIFSENKYSDQAATLILLAKCHVASVRHLDRYDAKRMAYIKSAISNLDHAKQLFMKLESSSKVKDIVYFQTILADEIEMHDLRNSYALEFKKLDAEHCQSTQCTPEFCSSL